LALGNINNRGFTIVELNISLIVFSVLMVSLMAVFMNFFVLTTRTNTVTDMTADSQNLLRLMVEELRYGAGVRVSNTITDANNPSGWNTTNTNFVIITAVPAIDSDDSYIIDSDTGSPYLNELVYFKQDDTLYKRVLAHPDATGNSLTTSCPASVASASCPADRLLLENVSSVEFTFYDQDNILTTDPLLTRSVAIDLTLERDTFGEPLTLDNSVRVTLRNTF
jgi:type II secretory pathway pseudopilin PulG